MSSNDKLSIPVALGTGNLGKVKNNTYEWKTFAERLMRTDTTPETWAEYQKLKPDAKNKLKNARGFWYPGHAEGGKRRKDSIKERRVGSFDCDNLTEEQLAELMGESLIGVSPLAGFEYTAHTTRSHDPENGKFKARIVFPFSRVVRADEFNAIMRIFAWQFDPKMRAVDPVSFRWAQMFFFPTVSVDMAGHFQSHRNEGALVDPDAILASWPSDWRDISTLPTAEQEAPLREHAKRAERPNEKGGLVGAFCRAYDVEDAITAFDLPYTPGQSYSGSKPRYTYSLGSGANGAVVEDGGLFLYSNHGTDPICDRLVNAWDLVRLHKFGTLDTDVPDGTPISKYPSHRKMVALALADEAVMAEYEGGKVEDKFEDLTDDEPTAEQPASSAQADDSGLTPEEEELVGSRPKPKKEGPLAEMNRKHAVAQIGNDIVILTFKQDHVAYNSLTELNLLYKNRQLPTGVGNATEPLSEWWVKQPGRVTYHNGVVFKPGVTDTPGAYNLWRGFAVEPNPAGSCDLYLDHIRQNICNGDPALETYLLDYFADMIQNPGVKPGVAVVLKGKKGVGKDVVGYHLGKLFPQNYVKISDSKHLVGHFNAHMEKALLLHVEEGMWGGDHKGESPLKSLITASIIPIERKGYDVIQMDSYLRLLITSNEEWAVPTDKFERRFAVFLPGDAHMQDRPYFRAMENQMKNGGYGALLHFLMTRKITTDIGVAPNTEGLAEQKIAGLKSVDEFWREILAEGEFPCDPVDQFEDTTWAESEADVFADDLYRAFVDWWKDRRGYGHGKLLSKQDFGQQLGLMTKGVRVKKQRTASSDNKRRPAHSFKPLPACREAFATYLGSPITWEDDEDLIG